MNRPNVTHEHRARRRAPLLVGAALLSLLPVLGQCGTLLRGEVRTCRDYADLDHALDQPQSNYFRDWSSADFDAAERWIATGLPASPSKIEQERHDLLAARRLAFDASGDLLRNDAATQHQRDTEKQEYDEQKRAEASENQAAQDSHQAATATHDACLRSSAYRQFVAGYQVTQALQREMTARQMLDHERRVQAVSGTANLNLQDDAGRMIVAAQDDVERWWGEYQRSGGRAESPHSIPLHLVNPCD